MSNCYECDTPLTTICPQCNALSAAFPICGDITCDGNPCSASPVSGEEEVEEMAIIMFESAGINIRWTDPHVTEGRRALWRAAARKAISAMNQRRGMERPTLSPEDRARVEALLRDALDYTGQRYAPIDTEACNEYARLCDAAHDKITEALSLIDKLTEAG